MHRASLHQSSQSRSPRAPLLGALAAALVLAALPCPRPQARAQSVTVDFARDEGPVTHRCQGYLYSWWHTRESPMHGNLELKPTSWRVGYWGTWDREYQPMVDQGVRHIQVILTDAFRNRGHATVGGFSHDPTWQRKSYLEVVEEVVRIVNERGWQHIAFDLINEPDAFGIDGVSDWYADAWVPAFRKVRELRPQAEIVGPGFFSPNRQHLRSFLGRAKVDEVVPDIISQHLIDDQGADVVERTEGDIRAMLSEFGLAQRPISFNEYINPGHVGFVEDIVDALAQGERVKVHSMMHSSWDDSGELPPWNSTGDAPCFDGILSIPAQRERAAYWVYKFYGDMAGRMVGVSRSGGWDGLASIDAEIPLARVLMGGKHAGRDVTLTLENLPASFGEKVDVRVERVTTRGNDLTAAPTLHCREEAAVSGGAAAIPLRGLPTRTAFMVTVSPAGLPERVAAPAFRPPRGTYWKPLEVTLGSETKGASIRYTTDGTVPTAASAPYAGPIPVRVTTTIRAIATGAGMRDSEVASGTFTVRRFENGVLGDYFPNPILSGEPVLTRGDPQIDFDYGAARWDASLPQESFSARWTGRLRATVSGTYQLHTESDDGVRLWLDGALLIDNWTAHERATDTASVTLSGGRDHELRMEYHDAGGAKVARLLWTPPGGVRAVIPSARLFPLTSASGADLLVGAGTSWKYLAPLDGARLPPAGWIAPGFDDSEWESGPARIGFGNDGEATVLGTSGRRPFTAYFRKSFDVPDPARLAAILDLALIRDDGAVVYLNGKEICRDNMPAGPIGHDTPALGGIGGANEKAPVMFQVPSSALVPGANVLAVEVHQSDADSDDLGFDCSLRNPTANTPPTLGPIADREASQGVPTPPIGFTVGDAELDARLLALSVVSSDPRLIPGSSFVFGGSGSSRTLSFTPAAGRTGTSTITVSASDGLASASTRFTVTVSDLPPGASAPPRAQQPATQQPATQQSATQQSATQQSATQQSATQQSATQQSATQQPATEPSPGQRPAARQSAAEPGGSETGDFRPARPNLVLILADDLGYGDVRCYNPERGKIPTPHLDRLASEGMLFTDAHSSSGVCSPSRYTLLTGRYHWRTRLQRGIVGVWERPLIAPGRLTIADLAGRHGYRTACFGKWHLGWDWGIPEGGRPLFSGFGDEPVTDAHREAWREVFSRPIGGGPLAAGFDRYFGTDVPNWPPFCFIEDDRTVGVPCELLRAELVHPHQGSVQGPALAEWSFEPVLPAIVERACAFIARAAEGPAPFLLYLPLTTPHTPLAVNEPWRGRSGLESAVADLIMETDDAVGRVLRALETSGAAAGTLVIFTSDNGFAPYVGARDLEARGHFPSGPLRGYKGDAWEGGHRVPFIARWPGVVRPATVCHHLVHQADVMATLADIFGTSLPEDAGEDSFSLLPALRGRGGPPREHAVSQSAEGLLAVRRGSWKLIAGRGGGGPWSSLSAGAPDEVAASEGPAAGRADAQLFDLAADPGETRNVVAAEPERAVALRSLLESLIRQGRSAPGPAQENDVEVRLPPRPGSTQSRTEPTPP